MKKNLLFLLGIGLITHVNVLAQFTIKNLNLDVQHSAVSVIDIEGDGDLDIVISGETGADRKLQVFLNDGAGNFTSAASIFPSLTLATFDWGDINQDGKPDLIEAGFDTTKPRNNAITGIYTSVGTGGTFEPYTGVTLAQLAPSSGFADLNNDGFLDIYVFGNDDTGGKSRIYFNNKTGGFTESFQFNDYKFIDPQVTVVDFDNDQDLDLFVNGYEVNSNARFSKMFVNNTGTFTIRDLGLIQKGNGSAVWGDYDGDGYLDLLMNGDGYANSGEDNDGIFRLYHNNKGASFTDNTTFSFYRQNTTGGGGRFLDWDNNGTLDIVVAGYNRDSGRQATAIFLNTSGIFTAYAGNPQIPGVSENALEVGDMDSDGDLDLILSGYSGNAFNGPGSNFNSNVSVIVVNPAAVPNVRPNPPSGLNVSGNQVSLALSWSAATDATTPQNALSYNLFLVDAAGKWYYYPLADTVTGKLKLQKMGNVNLNKGWIIKGLPAGTYRWGVQAIDNGFMGSAFEKSSFTINVDGTLPIKLKSFTAAADGKKRSKIEWSTASEQSNSHFIVERSVNGKDFYKLGNVEGKGTSGVANDYVMYDNNPSAEINYYKLLQYNKDGHVTEYGIKTVNFNNAFAASALAYPNPAKNDLGIRLSNFKGRQVTVAMTDMSGKLLHTEVIQTGNGQGYYKLHLKTKPLAGQYILVVHGEGLKESVKVIVH